MSYKHHGESAHEYISHMFQPARDTVQAVASNGLVKSILAFSAYAVSEFISDHIAGIMVLLGLVLLDQVTGVAVAVKRQQFTSTKFRSGLIKLFMYLVLIVAFHLLGLVVAPLQVIEIDKIATLYLAATEAFSIAENVNRFTGVPLPQWIRELLKSFGKKP